MSPGVPSGKCALRLIGKARSMSLAQLKTRQHAPRALPRADEDRAASAEAQQIMMPELLHRVRNDLQLVHLLAARSAVKTADPASAADFDAIGRRVLCMSELYDHLLGVGMSGTVDLGKYLQALCLKIRAIEHLQACHITLTTHTQSLFLELDAAVALGTAVNELVANAAKHAFETDNGGVVSVCLTTRAANGGRSGMLTVADNGCGLGAASPRSRGLDLVRRLVKRAGCELTHEPGNGTVWHILLPSRAPAVAVLQRQRDH